MKKSKIATALALFCLALSAAKAQTIEESLKSPLDKFDAAKTPQEMIAASSQLDLIAAKWPGQWISHYYTALSKIRISFALPEKTKRDLYLDVANVYLDKADKLSPNNQEILILQAWAAKARIAIDGQDRWKKFGEVYDGYIGRAKKINPENPRIYYLEGQGPFYKPKIWGGGKDKALPFFEKAKDLFARENKSNILVPHWGEKENNEMLKQCQE